MSSLVFHNVNLSPHIFLFYLFIDAMVYSITYFDRTLFADDANIFWIIY